MTANKKPPYLKAIHEAYKGETPQTTRINIVKQMEAARPAATVNAVVTYLSDTIKSSLDGRENLSQKETTHVATMLKTITDEYNARTDAKTLEVVDQTLDVAIDFAQNSESFKARLVTIMEEQSDYLDSKKQIMLAGALRKKSGALNLQQTG